MLVEGYESTSPTRRREEASPVVRIDIRGLDVFLVGYQRVVQESFRLYVLLRVVEGHVQVVYVALDSMHVETDTSDMDDVSRDFVSGCPNRGP